MTQSVILFDGVCNLCNQSVLFVVKRDPQGKFKFAALQSAYGQQSLRKHRIDPQSLHSIILLKGDKAYQRSRAALEIARGLTGLWSLLYVFIIVPSFIRNWFYDLVANNRYRWFGKKDECMIPTPELRSRFVE